MARLARVLSSDIPFHVTQRGNGRQVIFESDSDRMVYLDLLQGWCKLYRLSLVGYCLMTNHVHLIAIPRRPEALPSVLKQTHGRYATYFNARRGASGHLWQGRYYSCPLDGAHLWKALRYTELNPVRAGLVQDEVRYWWSSAAAHCGIREAPCWLEMDAFREAWSAAEWQTFLREAAPREDAEAIRLSTHTGRPLGSGEFVTGLEQVLKRKLAAQRGGRPRKEETEARRFVAVAEGWKIG